MNVLARQTEVLTHPELAFLGQIAHTTPLPPASYWRIHRPPTWSALSATSLQKACTVVPLLLVSCNKIRIQTLRPSLTPWRMNNIKEVAYKTLRTI